MSKFYQIKTYKSHIFIGENLLYGGRWSCACTFNTNDHVHHVKRDFIMLDAHLFTIWFNG